MELNPNLQGIRWQADTGILQNTVNPGTCIAGITGISLLNVNQQLN